MKLNDYVELAGITASELAAMVGVTYPTAWRWLHGTRQPNREQMRSIFHATKGAVTPNDLVL